MRRLPLAGDLTPSPRAAQRAVVRADGTATTDRVVVEEPLEIRLAGAPIAVTMRTPPGASDDDLDLAAGFLFTETALTSAADFGAIAYSTRADDKERRNVVEVTPAPGARFAVDKAQRSFYSASSCGLCGKATLDAIAVKVAPIDRESDSTVFSRSILDSMPGAMRAAQATFDATGGLHAAALFDATGALVVVREDIGRHNATDKVIGARLRGGHLPLTGHALLVSGRAGFEIVQKAAVARIPLLAAVSAPSSLAIDLAERLGVTLVAFLRPPKWGIYAHPWRIARD